MTLSITILGLFAVSGFASCRALAAATSDHQGLETAALLMVAAVGLGLLANALLRR